MNKSALAVNRLNLRNLKAAYVVTAVIFFALLLQDLIKALIAHTSGNVLEQYFISIGNYLWVLIPIAAIAIATKHFRRIMNLGGKRDSFFLGSLLTYLLLAAGISLVSTLVFYTYDRWMNQAGYFLWMFNCIALFGWDAHGPVVVFVQQFSFLFLTAAAIHTLTLLQDGWLGWAIDLAIVAILSVFIPIAPLRSVLMGFFWLILFNPSAILQILCCLSLAAVVYAASRPALSRKRI